MVNLDSCTSINTVAGSNNPCTGELEWEYYGYNPTLAACLAFLILFSVTTAAHLILGIWSKRWYMLCTMMVCGIGEIMGWAGRLWSNRSAEWVPLLGGFWHSNRTAFMIQIATLIVSPAFLAAGLYLTLGKLVHITPQYCRFNPNTYAITFIIGDVFSLLVQASGGGIAAAADTKKGAQRGANIMVAGIFIQTAVMVLYTFVLLEYIYRYFKVRPVSRHFRLRKKSQIPKPLPIDALTPVHNRNIKVTIYALCFATFVLFIRSVYRVIELLDGWNGPIIENETLFNFLDGLMILLALLTFVVFHPLWCLPRRAELDYAYDLPGGKTESQTTFTNQE